MSSVFSNLKPRPSVDRNGFDLSRRSVFSTKVGQILPVFCQSTLPNSEYKIDVKQLLRTQPMQTAAFSGFSINYDFVFVPNNNSFSSFNQFIAQKPGAEHVGQPTYTSLPLFNFKGFMRSLLTCCLWDYVLTSRFKPVSAAFESLPYVPRFIFVFDTCPWQSVCLSCLRSLDLLGYGNFLPVLKTVYSYAWNNLESYNASLTQPYNLATFNGFILALQAYLTNYIGQSVSISSTSDIFNAMSDWVDSVETSSNYMYFDCPDVNVSLWPMLAYNRAFYSFYRNVYYDTTNIQCRYNGVSAGSESTYAYPYVQTFNFDDWTQNYLASSAYSDIEDVYFRRLICIFGLKFHQHKKDLFTGVLPSTQFGNVSLLLDNRDWMNLYVRNQSSSPVSAHTPVVTGDSQITQNGSSALNLQNNLGGYNAAKFRFDPALAISVLESRRADAMQRFRERMLRAGNKVADVFKAHGWNSPLSEKSYDPIFLGTFDGRLDINTVAATSPSNGVELAQLGANGVGIVKGDTLHFKCSDFGVILGLMYIVKDCEYDAYGLEKQHCLTDPFDYPYPELQNISLSPIDTLEVSSYLLNSSVGNYSVGRIIGYLPRFMEYKTALDKVHGEFFSAGFQLSIPNNVPGIYDNMKGVFSDWVTPRQDLFNPTSLSFLYQSPSCADNIFLLASNECQDTDQFLVNCYFDCMAVEPVSVIGLPI